MLSKPIIYGNMSKYFGKKREDDGHTHHWTCYLRPYKSEVSIFPSVAVPVTRALNAQLLLYCVFIHCRICQFGSKRYTLNFMRVTTTP